MHVGKACLPPAVQARCARLSAGCQPSEQAGSVRTLMASSIAAEVSTTVTRSMPATPPASWSSTCTAAHTNNTRTQTTMQTSAKCAHLGHALDVRTAHIHANIHANNCQLLTLITRSMPAMPSTRQPATHARSCSFTVTQTACVTRKMYA